MAFCTNCGQQLADGAKFCAGCGKVVSDINSTTKRKINYDGEVHKCPQCGEVLDAFVIVCPSCGYELRGSSATSAVKEFAAKLDDVTTEYQKENIIRNFPIPNTKEDIFEFMILASSNIDCPHKEAFQAWVAKFEQCYQKAKLSFRQESDFLKIQAIYEKTQKTIKRIRRKGPLGKFIKIGLPIIIFVVLNVIFWSWVLFSDSDPVNSDKEIARLEAIVAEVEEALENKEYDLAMMHAKSIDFFPNHNSTSDYERQWDIERDYLIKKVIDAAAEDGIIMEYPTDTADEKDQESKSNDYNYKNGMEEIQNNIDEFNKHMDEVEDMWNQYGTNEPQE